MLKSRVQAATGVPVPLVHPWRRRCGLSGLHGWLRRRRPTADRSLALAGSRVGWEPVCGLVHAPGMQLVQVSSPDHWLGGREPLLLQITLTRPSRAILQLLLPRAIFYAATWLAALPLSLVRCADWHCCCRRRCAAAACTQHCCAIVSHASGFLKLSLQAAYFDQVQEKLTNGENVVQLYRYPGLTASAATTLLHKVCIQFTALPLPALVASSTNPALCA